MKNVSLNQAKAALVQPERGPRKENVLRCSEHHTVVGLERTASHRRLGA